MTPTTAAVHIGEVWIQEVIRAQEFGLEIAPRVFRDWHFKSGGDTYHVPRIPNIEVATKTAGSAWTPTTYTDTEQTVVINTHQVAGFEIEDITQLLTNTNLKGEMQKKIGYGLGRAVDVNLATLPQNFSNSVGTAGTDLVWDDLVAAWALMANAGVPLQEDCTWFFSPDQVGSFLKQDIIINALYAGYDGSKKAVEAATIGRILGAPVIQCNLLRSAGAGQHDNFLLHRRGVALIMAQNPKMVSEYIAKDLAWVIGGHQVYGFAEVDRYDETPGNVTATDNWLCLLAGL